MDIIKNISNECLKKEITEFRVGDKIRVEEKIVEQDRSHVQIFEGIVISRKGSGVSETFTVRKISYGIGVEKTYPLHSPFVQGISVLRKGKVHRAKLYYLRKKIGKSARIEEKEGSKEVIDTTDVTLGRESTEKEEN